MPSTNQCDTCNSNFACSTLNTVLRVMGRHKAEIRDARLLDRYEALVRQLTLLDWNFPEGMKSCGLSAAPRDIQRYTNELIEVWSQSDEKRRLLDDRNLYQEEVCCD